MLTFAKKNTALVRTNIIGLYYKGDLEKLILVIASELRRIGVEYDMPLSVFVIFKMDIIVL